MDVDDHPPAGESATDAGCIANPENTAEQPSDTAANNNSAVVSKSSEDAADADTNATNTVNNNESDPQSAKKSSRKRKKHIFNNIRQTMEFYFSDANLSKDRFLMRLIEEDPGKYDLCSL